MSVMILMKDKSGNIVWKRQYISWEARMYGFFQVNGKSYDLYGEPLSDIEVENLLFNND